MNDKGNIPGCNLIFLLRGNRIWSKASTELLKFKHCSLNYLFLPRFLNGAYFITKMILSTPSHIGLFNYFVLSRSAWSHLINLIHSTPISGEILFLSWCSGGLSWTDFFPLRREALTLPRSTFCRFAKSSRKVSHHEFHFCLTKILISAAELLSLPRCY